MVDYFDAVAKAFDDRYHVEVEIGRGGMATVYRATDRKHQRPVALKVLRPELVVTLAAERFLQEIQIAARLNHPHVLPLYDSGEAGGFLYYSMPLINGESLRERLERDTRLPLGEALRLAREMADGLESAHRQGVIHRDIKPANILLSGDHAIIADFGVAHAVTMAGTVRVTEGGFVVGTPEYMSPEQAAGEIPDARSDVYALGCVLYEMLAGQPPYTGRNAMAVLAKKASTPLPSLRAVRDDVPVALEQVVAQALANSPADRMASAAEFRAALDPERLSAPVPPALSIAVLPFDNLGGTPESDYLGDGIAEEITNALARIRALRVASRTSAFAFRHTRQDIRHIGAQLGVATILEGSIQRSGGGDRLRVTAQLIDCASGYHRWSERYDRQMEDVFAIQDEIAHAIVRALQVVLSASEQRAVSRQPARDVVAYEYYLQGRRFFHEGRQKSLQYAKQLYQKAIDADPEFALAYAGLADACSLYHLYYPLSNSDLGAADRASRRALELDPQLPEAHAARGFALFQMDRIGDAEPEFLRSIELDPQLFEGRYYLARARFQQGRFEEAAQLFEEAAQVREDYQARFLAAQSNAAMGEDSSAAYRRALHVIERHVELNPDDSRAVTMGAGCLSRVGEHERCISWATRALELDPEDPGVAYNVACVFAVEGRAEQALDCLESAVEHGFGNAEWVAKDPDFAGLRDHPRFASIMNSRPPAPSARPTASSS